MGKKQKPKTQHRRRHQRQRQKRKPSQLHGLLKTSDVGLPFDVLYEILVRAAVKTLGILRCVSKQCRTLVSSTSFVQDHYRRRSYQDPLMLLTRCEFGDLNQTSNLHLSTISTDGDVIKEFSITGLQQGMYVPLQSCLGLVCIGFLFEGNPILVCNPITEELVVLPPHRGHIHLIIGFGYAASSKEFKVVRFFRHPGSETDICDVFTFGSSGWREARNPAPHNSFYSNAPFLHGSLHMVPLSVGRCPHIVAFDIETEEYSVITLPEHYYSPKYTNCLRVRDLGGSLCVILEGIVGFTTEIWCLKDYDNRVWVKLCSIDLASLGFDIDEVDVIPIVLVPDETLVLEVVAYSIEDLPVNRSLYYYNLVSKSLTKDTNQNQSGLTYFGSTFGVRSGVK